MRPLTDSAPVLGNLREYRHKWYSAENYILWDTLLLQKVSAYLQPLLPNATRKLPNSVKYRNVDAITLVCDFLLVINTNLGAQTLRTTDGRTTTYIERERSRSLKKLAITTPSVGTATCGHFNNRCVCFVDGVCTGCTVRSRLAADVAARVRAQ